METRTLRAKIYGICLEKDTKACKKKSIEGVRLHGIFLEKTKKNSDSAIGDRSKFQTHASHPQYAANSNDRWEAKRNWKMLDPRERRVRSLRPNFHLQCPLQARREKSSFWSPSLRLFGKQKRVAHSSSENCCSLKKRLRLRVPCEEITPREYPPTRSPASRCPQNRRSSTETPGA